MNEALTVGSHAACRLPTLEDFAADSTLRDQVRGISVGFLDQEGLDDQHKANYLQRLVNTK
jgi:hypothetical protein